MGVGRRPQHLTELTKLWLASTVMGEVGAHNRGACPPGQNNTTIGPKKYCFDKLIGSRKTNSVMAMIIIHIAYISRLVTNDARHAYELIVVYKILHGARRI